MRMNEWAYVIGQASTADKYIGQLPSGWAIRARCLSVYDTQLDVYDARGKFRGQLVKHSSGELGVYYYGDVATAQELAIGAVLSEIVSV